MIRSVASQLSSLLIAVFFAVIVWVVATSDENPTREAYYPDALPIELVNRADNLMVYQKSVETARIKVRAPQVSWNELVRESFHATVDLGSLGAGLQKLSIQVQSTDPRVRVTAIEPATLNVQLEEIKQREFNLHSDVLDAPPVGYTAKTPIVIPSRVTVSGPAILVDQVAETIADVYLRGAKQTIERDVTIAVRDVQGNLVTGVVISPTLANVKIAIEQRVGYKDVSIRTVLKGAAASGYWVSNIVVTPSSATIVGNPDILAKIGGYVETVPIDVTGATADLSKRAALSLPEGTSVLSNEGVTVQVSVTPILGGQTVRRKVTLPGLPRNLVASISPDSVDVILSGPLPSLQGLSAENVQAVIDGAGLTPGTVSLKPRITQLPEQLKVQSIVPDTVQVVVSGAILVPTATPTSTPVITATVTVTPTVLIPPTTPTMAR